MSDLPDQLSETLATPGAIAVESANPTIISCAIAHSNGDPVTTAPAIAIASNPTIIAPAIPSGGNAYAPGSTNPYLVYLSQLAVFFAADDAGISRAYCPDGE